MYRLIRTIQTLNQYSKFCILQIYIKKDEPQSESVVKSIFIEYNASLKSINAIFVILTRKKN